jgi:hypothetical protein
MDEGSRQKPSNDEANGPAAAASPISLVPQADTSEDEQPGGAAKMPLEDARKSVEDATSVSGFTGHRPYQFRRGER